MKKIRRIALVFFIISILVLIFWKPIGVNIISYFTYIDFKNEFDKSNEFHVSKHIDDWSWQFGGSVGLFRLKKISNNTKLTPEGQKLAKEIFDHISSGKHLQYLKIHKEAFQGLRDDLDSPGWPANVLKVYLYDREVKRFE